MTKEIKKIVDKTRRVRVIVSQVRKEYPNGIYFKDLAALCNEDSKLITECIKALVDERE